MKSMLKKAAAALLLLAALAALAPCAMAATVRTAAPVQPGDTLPSFGKHRDCLGISASTEWLFQAYVGGRSIVLRTYGEKSDQLTFQEDLMRRSLDNKELRLSLRLRTQGSAGRIEVDQAALEHLKKLGVTEIVLADRAMTVIAAFETEDLLALREALKLGEKELLCIGGPDLPVTAVSEDGIRRNVGL